MTEEAYLELVLEKLKDKIAQIDRKIEGSEKDIESMHDYFWENYAEFDEYGYEIYDNNMALKSRVNEMSDYAKEKFRYEKMLDSPYFGRVNFCYEGEAEPEPYYIGIANLAEGRASEPYVFDWRTPVASLFYDYDKGPAQFEAPAGVLRGEITTKKQYKIKHGKLIYALENEMNIDDEILQQALSEHADAKLKNIVTTIQREQNSIIRDTSHRILAVQGCAGSGKTSVALHRIAYLLYHNRNKLKAGQVLILSPNSIFSDYISRILPELGEENICEMTFDDFAYRELRKYGEAEDRYDEIEKMLHEDTDEYYFLTRSLKRPTEEALYKQTEEYRKELDGYILELEWECVRLRDFKFKKMFFSEENISKMFYEKFCDVPIFERMHKIGEYLIDAEETLRGKNMEEEEQQIIYEKLERMYKTTDLINLYQRFLEKTGRETLDVSDGILRYEDVYPLLYLKYATMQKPERRPVKHLLIDEMQDYSYLQYLILSKMFDCPMTILGDRVQTMAEKQQDVLTFLPKIFGKEVHRVVLNKSYRSTSEIAEFAGRILEFENLQDLWEEKDAGKEEKKEPEVLQIERHGEKPAVEKIESEDAMYERILWQIEKWQEYDTIAVLTLDADSAIKMGAELKERICRQREENAGAEDGFEIYILEKDSMKFQPGISVMPFYLAKGLEFDAVIISDAQKYTKPLHRQALYIEATRALHALHLYQRIEK